MNSDINVLLIEDNPAELYTYKKILENENINVLGVNNGKKALVEISSNIDIIVMDVNLPDFTGFELCKKIKTTPKYSGIPILQISGTYVNTSDKIRALNIGADTYLTKPIEPLVLIASIKSLIRLKNTENELRKFVFWISHDLKAPIRAINKFSDILLNDSSIKLNKENKRFLDLIKYNGEKIDNIIDSLLSLSATNYASLKIEPINLVSIINDILSLYDTEIKKRNINIIIKFKTKLIIQSDKQLVYTIFENLINNSIKFTQFEKNPKIEIGLVEDKQEIYIYDNGIGIEEQDLNKVFLPFKKFISEKNFTGSGLGLAIILSAIRKLNWNIQVKSQKNEYTKFILTLSNMEYGDYNETYN